MTAEWTVSRLVIYGALLKCQFRYYADAFLNYYHLNPPSSPFERIMIILAELWVDRLSSLINQLMLLTRLGGERSETERPERETSQQSATGSQDVETPLCVRGFIAVFTFVVFGGHVTQTFAVISSIPSIFAVIPSLLSMFAAIISIFVSLRFVMMVIGIFILLYAFED